MSNTNKYGLLLIAALLLTGLLSSCLKENFDDCPRPFRLFIKAIDADQNDITASGEVERVTLFVFDENQQIVDALELNANAVKSREAVNIALDYPGHRSLKFVAWGNIDGSVEFPEKASVKQLSDLYLKLKSISATKATSAVAQTPPDLFHGSLDVPVEYGGLEQAGDQTVTITRRTSQVTVSAYAVKAWNGGKEDSYTFELHESNNGFDMACNLSGEMTGYRPQTQMDENGNLFAPLFQAIPTPGGKSYTLSILYNGEIIYSADRGNDGTPFIPEAGRLLNIIIDFRAEVSIKSIVTPWNQVFQYVEI
jgi:hypothetical protein